MVQLWSKTKSGGKAGFDRLYGWVDKLGPPVNRLSNKLGSEAFWPTTLDNESDKAARILSSFCNNGFYVQEETPSADAPAAKQKVIKRIPTEVIRNAKGLAIFTTMRTGLWLSGAGGSGVLIGRKEDGTWSPPSGIMLHTAGLGFLVGVDIYDCVVVINTQEALDAFSTVRCTVGGEISAVTGPVGIGGVLETEVHKRQAPVFHYLKSKGLYAGVQIDGTIIIERSDENERFYGERIGVKDILAGKVRHPPREIRSLIETIRSAQGDIDVDRSLLPNEPSPGDCEIEDERHVFGVPDKEDPDPFGVLALEQAGLEIREAGTQRRPTSEQFEFRPSPTSPVYATFRKSIDRSSMGGASRRSSWRASTVNSGVESRASTMVDIETQTDPEPASPTSKPPTLPPRNPYNTSPKIMAEIPEGKSVDEVKPKKSEPTNLNGMTETRPEILFRPNSSKDIPRYETKDESQITSHGRDSKAFDDIDLDFYDDCDEEEAVIEEVQQATAPQIVSRARMITVAKPMPPKLPVRSPLRTRKSPRADFFGDAVSGDEVTGRSPPGTPSLKNDGSSESTQDSISSVEGLEKQVKMQLRGHISQESLDTEGKEQFHSPASSPAKHVPGSFH